MSLARAGHITQHSGTGVKGQGLRRDLTRFGVCGSILVKELSPVMPLTS